jgi:aspartate/methionine/tyrosine aminotransferase
MDENFEFDPQKLEKAVNEKTKAIYLNSPHNPTGKVFRYEELEAIAKIAKKNNLLVISDEPYKSIIFEGEHTSMVSLPGMEKHTLIADSFSKDFNITGWRVGYAASKNKKLISRLMTPLVQSINTVSHPAQYALSEVIENPKDRESVNDMHSKMELLVKGLNSVEGISCVRPSGSFYIFPNVSGLKRKFSTKGVSEEGFQRLKKLGITDGFYEHVKNSFSWQLVDYLANYSADCAVIVAPGKEFGEAFDDYIRLSFASRTGEELSRFIDILKEAFGSKEKSPARAEKIKVGKS